MNVPTLRTERLVLEWRAKGSDGTDRSVIRVGRRDGDLVRLIAGRDGERSAVE